MAMYSQKKRSCTSTVDNNIIITNIIITHIDVPDLLLNICERKIQIIKTFCIFEFLNKKNMLNNRYRNTLWSNYSLALQVFAMPSP